MASGEFLFGVEIRKVVMVSPYFKRFWVSFKIVAESFECANDREEFFIMDVVVLFRRLE